MPRHEVQLDPVTRRDDGDFPTDLAQALKRLGERLNWHRQALTHCDIGRTMVEANLDQMHAETSDQMRVATTPLSVTGATTSHSAAGRGRRGEGLRKGIGLRSHHAADRGWSAESMEF